MAAELNRMAALQPVEIGIELVILVVTRLTARDVCARRGLNGAQFEPSPHTPYAPSSKLRLVIEFK